MAYTTGTFSGLTNLKTLIENAAVSAGWTLSGGWLSKGINNVSITSSSTLLAITGANNSTGSVEPAGYSFYLGLLAGDTVNSYHIVTNTNPEMVICVVNYNTDRVQMLMFGNIKKVNDSAFVGGNFFWASCTSTANTIVTSPYPQAYYMDVYDFAVTGGTYGIRVCHNKNGWVIPFCSSASLGSNVAMGLHAKINSKIWNTDQSVINYTEETLMALARSPNAYNGQAHLIPMNLQYAMGSSLYAYLGYIEFIRFIRVDNYNIGDTITLGSDQWKVFPWCQKSTSSRNGAGIVGISGGSTTAGTTGTFGFAIKTT
jgi:hypothetical protein